MSASTNPQLSFGVALDDEDMEILNPYTEEEVEDDYDPKRRDPDGGIDIRNAWERKTGDEFKFVEHCHSNAPMWLLTIRKSVSEGRRGEVVKIDPNILDDTGHSAWMYAEWRVKIALELKRLGLAERDPAGWLLTVMWM